MTLMLLEWVFTSVFLILVVLALRSALGKRISARMRYALWAVVLLRLLVPVQLFTSPIAGTWVLTEGRTERNVVDFPPAMTAPAAPGGSADGMAGLPVTGAEPWTAPTLPDPPAAPDVPEPPAAPDFTKAPAWLGWAWLGGSGLAALALLLSNLRFYGRLRRVRTRLEGADCPLRVYAAAGLPSPCLFGLIRPAVYVTPEAAADPAMLRHVLAHEYTHFRQGDHIWSLLRCAALAAHWWNPLVWLAAGLSRRDGELACDEGAIRRLGDGERAAYGNTLLALVTAKPGPVDLLRCATTMAGDKKSLKERITRIAQAPRRWLWAAVTVVLVTALACLCAFGQRAPEEGQDPDGRLWPYGVSEMTYVRDAGGFGGDFTVTLNQDGTFSYYAGYLSSYIGRGTWTQEDGVICLADEVLKDSAGMQYYYFTVEDGNLIFRAEGSAAFMYVDVKDGERFTRRADETDELRFSIREDGNVAISGMVDGLALGENTYWHPAYNAAHPIPYLALENPPHIAGNLEAWWWDDDGRTSVMVSTAPTAYKFSGDDPNTGYWTFIVDFSDGTGVATEMKSMASTPMKADSEAGLRLYPESISDEEAVAVGRLAARLMTAAEEWYNNHKTPEVETAFSHVGSVPYSSFYVPADVLDAAKAYVAAQFQADVPGGVLTTWGESYNDETGAWEPVLLAKAVPFDRVRIKSMEGPNLYTVQANGEDVEAELWKVVFEYHTTEPEFARNLLAGGMTLDGEGWMNFTGGFNYLAATGQGDRTITPFLTQADPTSVGFRNDLLGALQEAELHSDERYQNADGLYDANGEARDTDLDRDGVKERVQMCDIYDAAGDRPVGRRVEIWEGERLLFSEEGYFVHAGYNALFLCEEHGREYLLRYHPTMYQGRCDYSFKLFTLSRTGEEITIREGTVDFDINFQPWIHEGFDSEAIAAFMDEVNGLLENSVQLLNTDEYLADTFEREGRLYDSLWWLDMEMEMGEGSVYTRDEGKSLLENLRGYQRAMEMFWYAGEPEVLDMREAGSDYLRLVRLRYQDRTADFFANWDSHFQPPDQVKPQVLDLNGDGRDEIVCVFTCDHGTGVFGQELHAFDARTLEEYDLSGLREDILGQIKSTGDGENFYLSGLGMDETISKSGIRARVEEKNGDFIMADALSLGEWIGYGVKDGRVYCRLGCDPTGMALIYPGYVNVGLDFTGSGFRIGEARYEADGPFSE